MSKTVGCICIVVVILLISEIQCPSKVSSRKACRFYCRDTCCKGQSEKSVCGKQCRYRCNTAPAVPKDAKRLECTHGCGCVLKEATSFRFFLLGDTGGEHRYPYYNAAQQRVAKQTSEMAAKRGTQFQFSLGDNFYNDGVTKVDDPRFKSTFENIYTSESLKTPWYVLAGNHDHYGNVKAQVEYTKRSNRWTMPSLYYSVKYRLADGTSMEAVMIDTATLTPRADAYKNVKTYWNSQDVAKQWTWIEDTLRKSTANYLFVMGHYPVYAATSYGPNAFMISKLKPLLDKYKVTAYIFGHEHNLQYIKPTGSNVAYVDSGAASRTKFSPRHVWSMRRKGWLKLLYPEQSESDGSGFVYTEIDKNGGRFEFYDRNAKLIQPTFSFQPRM